jgi:hypothetical protein
VLRPNGREAVEKLSFEAGKVAEGEELDEARLDPDDAHEGPSSSIAGLRAEGLEAARCAGQAARPSRIEGRASAHGARGVLPLLKAKRRSFPARSRPTRNA